MSWDDFVGWVTVAARNMETMDHCARDLEPLYYEGKTLLILAPESEEFRTALEVNKRHCADIRVVDASGTHYNILQEEHAPTTAACVMKFLRELGYQGLVTNRGLRRLSTGS